MSTAYTGHVEPDGPWQERTDGHLLIRKRSTVDRRRFRLSNDCFLSSGPSSSGIHKAQLAESLETLETADAQVHGLVLNKIARRDSRPYMYENGYYSSKPVAEEARVTASA